MDAVDVVDQAAKLTSFFELSTFVEKYSRAVFLVGLALSGEEEARVVVRRGVDGLLLVEQVHGSRFLVEVDAQDEVGVDVNVH